MTELYNEHDYLEIKKNKKELAKIIYNYDGSDYEHIRFNNVGLYSVTPYDHGEFLINKVLFKIFNMNKVKSKLYNILETSAGMGGNTLGLLSISSNITACELDKNQFSILQNNMNIITNEDDKKTYNLINDNFLNFLDKNKAAYYDFIFCDPPWNFTKAETISHDTIRYKSNEAIEDTLYNLVDFGETIIMKTFMRDDFNIYLKRFSNHPSVKVYTINVSNTKMIILTKRRVNYKALKEMYNTNIKKFDYRKYIINKS